MTSERDKSLDALRGEYHPSSEDRDRIWTKLHAAAAAATPSKTAPRASRGPWMLASACVILAIGGAAVHFGARTDAPRTLDTGTKAAATTTSAAESTTAPPPSVASAADAPLESGTPAFALPTVVNAARDPLPARKVTTSARPAPAAAAGSAAPIAEPISVPVTEPTTAPAPRIDTLEEETRLLTSAIRAPDKSRTLALLDEHAARFPRGVLAGEREVQRILALCALGRVDEATKSAERFLHGRTPDALSRRVERSCARR